MSQQRRKTYAIAGLVIGLAAWLGTCIWIWGHRNDGDTVQHGTIATTQRTQYEFSAPANFRSMNSMSSVIGGSYNYTANLKSFNVSGNASYGVTPMHMSSSAEMHSFGGGSGSNGGIHTATARRNSNDVTGGAIAMVSTSAPSIHATTTISQASEAIGGGQTADESGVAMGIMSRAPQLEEGNRAPGYDPADPWKAPIGDMPWMLLLLMGSAYLIVKNVYARARENK